MTGDLARTVSCEAIEQQKRYIQMLEGKIKELQDKETQKTQKTWQSVSRSIDKNLEVIFSDLDRYKLTGIKSGITSMVSKTLGYRSSVAIPDDKLDLAEEIALKVLNLLEEYRRGNK